LYLGLQLFILVMNIILELVYFSYHFVLDLLKLAINLFHKFLLVIVENLLTCFE